MAVKLYCTLINHGIYFIVALRQSELHQFQAVNLEYSAPVKTVISSLKPRGNFKYHNYLNLKSIKFHQGYLGVLYDPQNKEMLVLYPYTAIPVLLFSKQISSVY